MFDTQDLLGLVTWFSIPPPPESPEKLQCYQVGAHEDMVINESSLLLLLAPACQAVCGLLKDLILQITRKLSQFTYMHCNTTASRGKRFLLVHYTLHRQW